MVNVNAIKKCKDCGYSKCKCSSKQEQKVDQNVKGNVIVPANGNQGPQGAQKTTRITRRPRPI